MDNTVIPLGRGTASAQATNTDLTGGGESDEGQPREEQLKAFIDQLSDEDIATLLPLVEARAEEIEAAEKEKPAGGKGDAADAGDQGVGESDGY